MASLIEKLKTLFKANLHDVADTLVEKGILTEADVRAYADAVPAKEAPSRL